MLEQKMATVPTHAPATNLEKFGKLAQQFKTKNAKTLKNQEKLKISKNVNKFVLQGFPLLPILGCRVGRNLGNSAPGGSEGGSSQNMVCFRLENLENSKFEF